MAHPQVSKHLRVLREVGAVGVRDEGRRRVYRLNGEALKPIHDWAKGYEDMWTDRFRSLDMVVRSSSALARSGAAKVTLPTAPLVERT